MCMYFRHYFGEAQMEIKCFMSMLQITVEEMPLLVLKSSRYVILVSLNKLCTYICAHVCSKDHVMFLSLCRFL